MNPDDADLQRMANQIAMQFAADAGAGAAPSMLAEHLQRFWSPDMRRRLREEVCAGRLQVHELVAQAAERGLF